MPLYRSYKTFLIAYLYFALPKIARTAYELYSKKLTLEKALLAVKRILIRTAAKDRLPWFLARLVLTFQLANSVLRPSRSARPVAILLAAYTSYAAYKSAVISHGPTDAISNSRLSNISSELTAMVTARALDSLVRSHKPGRRGDAPLFAASASIIMYAWFYFPQRLQPRYRKWITDMAQMDVELLDALRLIRSNDMLYGVPNPHDTMLAPICARIGLPADQGNTTKTVPIPCTLIHSNATSNCELHALWRFYRGFSTAFLIYVPLNLLLTVKRGDPLTLAALRGILKSSSRSSAFLATFILLCWYGVCLVRTRLGPRLFPKATPQQLESGWGPMLGSVLCGVSIFIEDSKRHAELALFVASKALDILLPARFGERFMHLDTWLFTASLAVLVSKSGGPGARGHKQKVEGVFGKLLGIMF